MFKVLVVTAFTAVIATAAPLPASTPIESLIEAAKASNGDVESLHYYVSSYVRHH